MSPALDIAIGFEEELGYSKNLFKNGSIPGSSVLTLMSDVIIGPRIGYVRPYGAGGFGRLITQRSPSLLNKPVGIAVPGLICDGSSSQRKVHSGFKRSPDNRKFGAMALASCDGSPVM